MADTAVHLTQQVLPAVPIRHWIGSLPWGLRALLGYDRVLCAEVVGAVAQELLRSLRQRAKRQLGLASVADAHTGAVAAIQRTDGAMRLNVHAHVLALDGVYVREGQGGALVFHPLPAPTRADVTEVARRTAARVERILRARGRSLDPQMQADDPHAFAIDEPGLADCYAASAQGISVAGERAGKPTLRLVVSQDSNAAARDGKSADEPIAEVRGINVHAKQRVDGRDRPQLERLCRYITRPPLAQERLTRRTDGRLELELKKVWRDGTRALVLEPYDLLTRLVASVPPPRLHLLADRPRRRATNSCSPRSTAATTTAKMTPTPRRASAGRGCSLTSFAPTSTPALAAVVRCAGSMPRSGHPRSRAFWPRTAWVRALHHRGTAPSPDSSSCLSLPEPPLGFST
jgi:Putative transposase